MTTNLSRFFFSLILLIQLPGFAAADCTIPGTERSCGELVSNLPWLFNIHVKEEKPVRITYLSSQGTQESDMHLKMFLETSDHGDRDAAAEALTQMHQKADPDMGLSYGWDMVTIRGKRLYRLHADCTLAESYFHSMGQTLVRLIGAPDRHTPQALFCRCGGGCKKTNGAPRNQPTD